MYVSSTGLVCPVGLSAPSACAAMRAGISGFGELPYTDNFDEAIIGGAVPIEGTPRRIERLVRLLGAALIDCLRHRDRDWSAVPLFICLAEPERPGGGARFASNIQTLVEAETGVRFDARRSETITKGHTAGAEALQLVGRALGSGIGSCIVCAVDSYLNAETLHWLEVAHRLKRRGNSNGVIPGEAAAAILVERNAALEGDEAARIRITGIGFGEEPATVFSKDPMLGRGLADAGRAALAQSGRRAEEIAFRLSDVTGEAYGFKEQALAIARLLRSRREEFPIWHASDSIGDVGAASGLVQVIMASEGFKKHYAPGSRAICFSTGVGRHRASVVVEDQA